jgi:hypothetical protein
LFDEPQQTPNQIQFDDGGRIDDIQERSSSGRGSRVFFNDVLEGHTAVRFILLPLKSQTPRPDCIPRTPMKSAMGPSSSSSPSPSPPIGAPTKFGPSYGGAKGELEVRCTDAPSGTDIVACELSDCSELVTTMAKVRTSSAAVGTASVRSDLAAVAVVGGARKPFGNADVVESVVANDGTVSTSVRLGTAHPMSTLPASPQRQANTFLRTSADVRVFELKDLIFSRLEISKMKHLASSGGITADSGLDIIVFSEGQVVILDDNLSLRDICQHFWDERDYLVLHYRYKR